MTKIVSDDNEEKSLDDLVKFVETVSRRKMRPWQKDLCKNILDPKNAVKRALKSKRNTH